MNDLLKRAQDAEKALLEVTKQRDAAIEDLLRAEEAAGQAAEFMDDRVHPVCDYGLYLALRDTVDDIVNWRNKDIWGGIIDG